MNPVSSPTARPVLFTPPGRIASVVIRYHDYQEFFRTAQLLQALIKSTQASPLPSSTATSNRQVYRTPLGSGNATLELRLICHDTGPAQELASRGKKRVSTYYQVGQEFATPAEAENALRSAIAAAQRADSSLTVLGNIEQDGDASLLKRAATQRVILADDSGDNQVCLLVNPPFPRGGGGVTDGSKMLALLTAVLGLGALLFGGIELLRRR